MHEPIVYVVGTDDRILEVNDAWRSFACANGAPEVGDRSVGSSLWDSIAGTELQMLWRDVLVRARLGTPMTLPFRCDAPDARRELELRIRPLDAGRLEFTSTTRTVRERAPIALVDAPQGDSEPLSSCSWCRRFWVGAWVEVEVAIEALELFDSEPAPVSHGLCPDCDREVRAAAGL